MSVDVRSGQMFGPVGRLMFLPVPEHSVVCAAAACCDAPCSIKVCQLSSMSCSMQPQMLVVLERPLETWLVANYAPVILGLFFC